MDINLFLLKFILKSDESFHSAARVLVKEWSADCDVTANWFSPPHHLIVRGFQLEEKTLTEF